jgi:hypothetical protein
MSSDSSGSFLLTCNNQRIQRSQFFFYEGANNVRFNITSPYVSDASGNLIYTPKQLDMRRKAEILKYIKPIEGNVSKKKYSQLAKQSNKQLNRITCNNNIEVPTSSSDVPGPVILLKEDPNVPLYKYYSEDQQFQFQDIEYDEFKRLFDLFPLYNISSFNGINTLVNTIVILRPKTNELTFDFSFPICIQFEGDYTEDSTPSGIDNINISIYSTQLDIFYSDTLITSVNGIYRTSPTELPSDIAQSTVTISADLKASTNGKVSINRYVGNVIFPNITLASVSQYVYTCKLNIKISYGEYNETSLSRSNTDGNNIDSTGEVNLKNVKYNPYINIASETNPNFNKVTNCTFVLYSNANPPPPNPEISELPLVPLSITTD